MPFQSFRNYKSRAIKLKRREKNPGMKIEDYYLSMLKFNWVGYDNSFERSLLKSTETFRFFRVGITPKQQKVKKDCEKFLYTQDKVIQGRANGKLLYGTLPHRKTQQFWIVIIMLFAIYYWILLVLLHTHTHTHLDII